MSERYGIDVVAADEARDAFCGVDVVAGCTDSVGNVIVGEWLEHGTHVTCIGGSMDSPARTTFDSWLRLGNVPAPVNDPAWRRTYEYLPYVAGPDDPVWAKHRHGRPSRPPEVGRGPRLVTFDAILRGTDTARGLDTEITFSERGNIQGAQFFAVRGTCLSTVS